jgi:hypothetical protein
MTIQTDASIEQKRCVAAAAVAIALAEEYQLKAAAAATAVALLLQTPAVPPALEPRRAEVSPWQAVMRANQLIKKSRGMLR